MPLTFNNVALPPVAKRNAGCRVEDGRGSLEPFGKRPVSHPRSSNPTCRFPALGFPIDFTARHTTVGRSMWHRARIPRRVTTFACDMSFL